MGLNPDSEVNRSTGPRLAGRKVSSPAAGAIAPATAGTATTPPIAAPTPTVTTLRKPRRVDPFV